LFFRQFVAAGKNILRDAIKTGVALFKIIIPLSIITKILTDAGVTDYLGQMLSPVMQLIGLPGSMGLVWATTMVTNIYGGITVFAALSGTAALAPAANLTVAQVTVLTTMMLVAHSLPVEIRITQVAGLRLWTMLTLRIGCALVLGWLLYQIYAAGNFLQTPNEALWSPPLRDPSWLGWAQAEIKNLATIFLIILGLIFLMRLLAWFKIINLLEKLLEPILTRLGMSRAAAPTTIIGMILGLSYGGGLIIQEAHSGRLGKHNVFFSLALLSICHSIIEDGLLMALLGGHLSGVLWARVGFSLLVIFLLVQMIRRMPEATFDRWFLRRSFAVEGTNS